MQPIPGKSKNKLLEITLKMKKLLLFSLFYFCFISTVYSQNDDRWVYITSDGDFNFSVYYDTETIKYNGNNVTVNLKFIYSSESKDFWNRKYSIIKYIYYCSKEQYQLVSNTTYYKNGEISTININKIDDVIPESVSETVYRLFCK